MGVLAVCVLAFVFGFVGSMPLAGPVSVMVLSRAARGRFEDALRVGAGAALAEAVYAGAAYFGFAALLSHQAVIAPISRAVSAAVLVALGVRFVAFELRETKDSRDKKAGTLALGLSVSALNPTLLLTWSAAVAFLYSKGLHGASPADAAPFGACAGAGVAAWFFVLVKTLRRYEGKLPRGLLTATVRALGLVLVGLGVWSGTQIVSWAAGG